MFAQCLRQLFPTETSNFKLIFVTIEAVYLKDWVSSWKMSDIEFRAVLNFLQSKMSGVYEYFCLSSSLAYLNKPGNLLTTINKWRDDEYSNES